MQTITTPAWAKINLGLFVVGRRPDGYHNILTVFHRINLCDEILFRTSDTLEVVTDTPEAPSGERNICFKAATLVREAAGVARGAHISIRKNIPVGAGLGGGSADAAAVLLHLPLLWGVMLDEGQLRSLALRLGSDVPYFLGQGSAIASGRGECLEYFELDLPFTILLCHPGIHVSTAWAYTQVRPVDRSSPAELKGVLLEGLRSPARLREQLINDFESPVCAAHPAVRSIKEEMIAGGAAFASMSGSGSSVYGFFTREESAHELASLFRTRNFRTAVTPAHFRP
jgi:4-diphosphocytidyl-2-C-methyl-D-erythritol kinase